MKAPALMLAAALILGGCAGFGDIAGPAKALLGAETPEERDAAFKSVVDDVKEAQRSAAVHEDQIALACWNGVLARLDRIDGSYFTDVKGVASGLQKTRNIRRLFTDLSEDIRISCAALASDTKSRAFSIFKLIGLPGL